MTELDFNLLRVFTAIYRCSSLTAAARELHVTQPSVSHALSRLRERFDDPLFVRSGGVMRPTALADELHASLAPPLAQLERTVASTASFDPATSTRRFRLCLTDVGELSLLPRILERVTGAAPGVEFEVVPMDIDRVADWLVTGVVDIAIASARISGNLRSSTIMADTYGCLVRRDSPVAEGAMTLDAFLSVPQVVVAASSGHTLVERTLAGMGLAHRTAVLLHHFSVIPYIVDSCGFIGVIPREAGQRILDHWPLALVDPPFEVPAIDVRLYWQGAHRESAAVRWLRHQVLDALEARPAG